MVTSKAVLEIIKRIIDKRYSVITLSLLGRGVFTKEQLKKLADQGIDVSNKTSLIELAYYHNYLNPQGKVGAPTSVEDMEAQQSSGRPQDAHHPATEEHLNESMKAAIDKLRQDYTTRIESHVRNNNQNFKFNSLHGPERTSEVEKLVKESTLQKLKQTLRDSSGDGNRDWLRVATTELSNSIGVGSVDRIAKENKDKDLNEVYVYRIVVDDAALCKYCRKFYQDSDGSPKVYRLSTLLGNGSNYGKKAADWLPVSGATHPNERCSQIIEVRRGWKVLPGGKQTYIGPEAWNEYIVNKITA
jgi:hypothetical protein